MNFIFAVNIVITFFTAEYDDEYNLLSYKPVRKTELFKTLIQAIARAYLSSWFIIDVTSVLPFD